MSNENHKIEVRDLRQGDWLWTHKSVLFSDLPDSAYRVYAALAAYADNRDQRSWPSMSTIAEKIRSSKSTVVRAMKLLEATQLVQVDRRDGTSNLYTLLPSKQVVVPIPKKSKSPHHQLVAFFHDTCVKYRGVKPAFSPRDTKRLKDVLEKDILQQKQIEQLMLYFLASYQFKKFSPSLATFFSSGIFNGLMNAMQNDENFWKDVDKFSVELRPQSDYVRTNIPMRSMQDMVSELAQKMSMAS